MPAGSVQYIIRCDVVNTSGRSTAPCVSVGSTGYAPNMVQAYVIDPAAASFIDALAAPYDYAGGAALFTFGFSMVVGLWFVSRNIGLILDAVRKF